MILMIDNYDSFTYNLVQYFGELGQKLVVFRNDQISLRKIEKLSPKQIVISPGPGRPEESGICNEVIRQFAGKIPMLGVCLGHQSIGYVFGAEVGRSDRLMHGKTSMIYHNKKEIFKNIPNPLEATRYQSLIVRKENLPNCLKITAETKEKEIMGLRHKKFSIWGVQFHPESILTKAGMDILRNFLEITK